MPAAQTRSAHAKKRKLAAADGSVDGVRSGHAALARSSCSHARRAWARASAVGVACGASRSEGRGESVGVDGGAGTA